MVAQPNTPQLSQFAYDPKSLRYRDLRTGRFVKPEAVRNAVDVIIDAESLKIRALSQQLIDGKINLAEWQVQMSARVKTLHVAMGLAANGGLKNTSASDLGFIGSRIKQQYKYLRNFALQIKRGDQPLNGSLLARSGQYAQAARGTYEQAFQRKAVSAGLALEKSILGAADHCPGCLREAAKGWSDIGSLIPVGSRQCRGNCRCHFIYKGGGAQRPDLLSFEEMIGQFGASRGGAAVAEPPILPGQVSSVVDLRVKYPKTTFEFNGVDPALHGRIARHIDELFAEFPNVARSLNYVGSDRFSAQFGDQYARSAALATRWSGSNQGLSEIHLNPAVWGDAVKFQEKLDRALERGYIPPRGNKPEAILTHEFGHVVNYHIDRTSNAANRFMEENEHLGSLVSGYASTDPQKEAWAEAFSSIRHTPPEQWAEYTKRLKQFLGIGRRE